MNSTNPQILVVGDQMVDRYVLGQATRLSPEAPIPIVAVNQVLEFSGGAANVLMNLQSLGLRPYAIFGFGCPIKTRVLAGNQQLVRYDQDDQCRPCKMDWRKWERPIQGVIISDYGKGSVTQEIIDDLPVGVPYFVDTKRSPDYYDIPSTEVFYFPNERESKQFPLYSEYEHVVYKRGPLGMQYHDLSLAALCKLPVCTTGAGDTTIAAFAKRYLEVSNPYQALAYANVAAGVVCGKAFTATATEEEIQRYLRIYEY